jgi:hypothetical protein
MSRRHRRSSSVPAYIIILDFFLKKRGNKYFLQQKECEMGSERQRLGAGNDLVPFPCLVLCLSLPAFVPFLACLCVFPCLPLSLSLPACVCDCHFLMPSSLVRFLACLALCLLSLPAFACILAWLYAFPCLPLCVYLPVFCAFMLSLLAFVPFLACLLSGDYVLTFRNIT